MDAAELADDRNVFQSTLSMRRATLADRLRHMGDEISIHALHEESDALTSPSKLSTRNFNPRSP